MYESMFILLLVLDIYFMAKYYSALSRIASFTAEKQKSLGLFSVAGPITSLSLFSDVRFFLMILKRSYLRAAGLDADMMHELDLARKYLLLQYPVTAALLLLPFLLRFFGGN